MMKVFCLVVTWLTGMSATVSAVAPATPSMSDYRMLLKRSPFIIKKPAVPVVQPKVNSSLTLRGVAKLSNGWFVTVVDRKAPKENIVLREGRPVNAKGLRLIKVNQNNDDYKKTTVIVMSGGRQITIGYNPADIKNSLVKATRAAAVKPAPRVNTTRMPIPTASKSGATPPKTNSSGRRPRVRRRVTPPPVPRTK